MYTSYTLQSEIEYRSSRIRQGTGRTRRHRLPLVRRPAGSSAPQRGIER